MNFLFYRYNSICEPYMINSLQSLGHTIKTIDTEITWKNVPARKVVEIVSDILLQESFDGLISVNYYPVLSEICRIFKLRYLSWTVDSPVLELLSDTISNEYNRLFLFDYQQYQDLVMYNPDNIFYLPLATNTTHWDNIIIPVKITANIKVIFLLLVHYILKNAPMTILLLHQSTYPDIWMALWLPRKKYMVIFS